MRPVGVLEGAVQCAAAAGSIQGAVVADGRPGPLFWILQESGGLAWRLEHIGGVVRKRWRMSDVPTPVPVGSDCVSDSCPCRERLQESA